MKHILLEKLDSKISETVKGLDKLQALAMAGLGISRLWMPFKQWALENKAAKLAEWGKICVDILWEQISLEQLYGQNFEKYYKYLDKIDGKIEQLADKEIVIEESIAYPLLEALENALCCFFDPKLLPGLQKLSFHTDITAIVGQGAEYIYDDIFSAAGNISENGLMILVEQEPRWLAECCRISADADFLKTYPKNMAAVLKRKEQYMQINIFAQTNST